MYPSSFFGCLISAFISIIAGWYLNFWWFFYILLSYLRGSGMFILWICCFRSLSKASNTQQGLAAWPHELDVGFIRCKENVQQSPDIFLHMCDGFWPFKVIWSESVLHVLHPEYPGRLWAQSPKGAAIHGCFFWSFFFSRSWFCTLWQSNLAMDRSEEIRNGIFSCKTCCFSADDVWVGCANLTGNTPFHWKKHGFL